LIDAPCFFFSPPVLLICKTGAQAQMLRLHRCLHDTTQQAMRSGADMMPLPPMSSLSRRHFEMPRVCLRRGVAADVYCLSSILPPPLRWRRAMTRARRASPTLLPPPSSPPPSPPICCFFDAGSPRRQRHFRFLRFSSSLIAPHFLLSSPVTRYVSHCRITAYFMLLLSLRCHAAFRAICHVCVYNVPLSPREHVEHSPYLCATRRLLRHAFRAASLRHRCRYACCCHM